MTEEEWSIASDVEDCESTPEELDAIYTLLDKGGTIELKWKCPGKRAPSPRKEEVKTVETPENKAKQVKEMEFDFMDDVTLPQIRHRQPPAKSAMKKKTNFDGVINAMRKHGRLSGSNPQPTSSPSTAATISNPPQN